MQRHPKTTPWLMFVLILLLAALAADVLVAKTARRSATTRKPVTP